MINTKVNVKLHSDFHDYYDHHFDREGDIVFERMMRGGPSRSEAFKILQDIGCLVPPHGTPTNLVWRLAGHLGISLDNSAFPSLNFVVYEDEQSHAGDGKLLLSAREAMILYPDKLVSLFIPQEMGKPVSWRYLQIGTKSFWMSYESNDLWRSNYEGIYAGYVDIRFLAEQDAQYSTYKVPYPIFAIDFVYNGTLYAIDLNISPGIAECVQEKLPAQEAAALIKTSLVEIVNHIRTDI